MTPVRIQRRRAMGWRMPENTVVVARPSKWGNPFTVTTNRPAGARVGGFYPYFAVPTVADAIDCYRLMFEQPAGPRAQELIASLHELRGQNLACWCRLCDAHQSGRPLGVACSECAPCHADVLLELANEVPE